MNGLGPWVGAGIGAAMAAAAVVTAGLNWMALVQGLTGKKRSSPILMVGPLFALLAGWMLRTAFPQAPAWLVWLPAIAVPVLDPGALPLVAWLLIARWRSRATGPAMRQD